MVLCEKTAADRFGVAINITPGDASLADCRMAYSFGDHLIEYLGPMGESMTPAGVQVGREDPNPTHKCPNTFFQEFEGWWKYSEELQKGGGFYCFFNERTMMINPSLINHLDLGVAPFGAQFEELISNMFSISTAGFGGVVPRIW